MFAHTPLLNPLVFTMPLVSALLIFQNPLGSPSRLAAVCNVKCGDGTTLKHMVPDVQPRDVG